MRRVRTRFSGGSLGHSMKEERNATHNLLHILTRNYCADRRMGRGTAGEDCLPDLYDRLRDCRERRILSR